MILTLYGKRENAWTDKVRDALSDVVSYTLVEDFKWARDESGKDEACRVDKDGVVWISKIPTIRLVKWEKPNLLGYIFDPYLVHFITQPGDEWWVIGVDNCLGFIERHKDEVLQLR